MIRTRGNWPWKQVCYPLGYAAALSHPILFYNLFFFQQGGESDAEKFQVTITLFREEEYGKMDQKKVFSAQRSYTGKVSSPIEAQCG